jgi:hypothetical protein
MSPEQISARTAMLELIIKDEEGNEESFVVKRTDQLQKLFDAYRGTRSNKGFIFTIVSSKYQYVGVRESGAGARLCERSERKQALAAAAARQRRCQQLPLAQGANNLLLVRSPRSRGAPTPGANNCCSRGAPTKYFSCSRSVRAARTNTDANN